MKALKFRELNVEDRLRLNLAGDFDPQADIERELEPLFRTLEAYANDWMPDVVEGKRQRKYSRAAIWKSFEEKQGEKSTSLVLGRTQLPAVYLWLTLWFPPLPPELKIWLDVQPLSLFAQAERCRMFVDMVREWVSRYPVPYASAHSMADDQLTDSPNFDRDDDTTQRDGFDQIYEVFWLNVFGPKLVETVGRERMLSTPAWRVEELPNGSILLVTWPTAADFATEDARLAQARALVHLRPELDLQTVLSTLRERSASLAPVEPRFHPDVAPLLMRAVDEFALHERQRKIAGFNAWQPPEPDEWLPADAALPPDVNDLERAREHYSTLAEHLVAMLHTRVPSIFQESPGSLTDADFFFWSENFPKTQLPEVLDSYVVPAVGAYLGEVLVRHLGGQWLPRKELGEAQVLVGERVWLPFVRAHRYLRSRQSLLDSSLTQFYRVAERHRAR